jgi:hypothetical protein
MADKALDALAASFGIATVAPENVPAPPRPHDRDDARWAFIAEYLPTVAGQWLRVKTYENSGASTTASLIREGKNKRFPSTHFNARSESIKGEDGKVSGSVLYMTYNVPVEVSESE